MKYSKPEVKKMEIAVKVNTNASERSSSEPFDIFALFRCQPYSKSESKVKTKTACLMTIEIDKKGER